MIGRALAVVGLVTVAAAAVWALPRLVAERRFQARLARPGPPWPPVPGGTPAQPPVPGARTAGGA